VTSESARDPEIITFGCRLNSFESEVMRRLAREGGVENAVVINTCAVTSEAERQARQAIRKARRENPTARIIVTGCAAQIAPESYATMPEVDEVLGNAEKLMVESFSGVESGIHVTDIQQATQTAPHLIEGFEGRTRAFLQVQQGCDHRCTFCIIPFGRGPSRSVPLPQIIDQARVLAAGGYREFILTGVDLTSYGGDLPGQPRLGSIVAGLLKSVPEIERLRLSSLDPDGFDPELIEIIVGESRLMPHLHLSLQAGDDMILKRMKRRHDRAMVLDLCENLRRQRKEIVFGADLIAGFPTETDEMFENTLSIIKECDLTQLHVFPYSPRPGTPAADMPQVPAPVRKSRAARLREAGEAQLTADLSRRIGSDLSVLVEKPAWGRSESFASVKLEGCAEIGGIVSARAVAIEGMQLIARVATQSQKAVAI
jgi:threonylcarbamoyladenosine tRNA methylthiotransferase MtaB